ncbi:MAG: DUF1501 domain-containing protein [Planctomycetota bacterium]|nr:DUF1501 domain-containing protein [Planctomycetota bacterium]
MLSENLNPACCLSRRGLFAGAGLGLAGIALQSLLVRDGLLANEPDSGEEADWSPPDGRPHRAPQAKQVILLMMRGGFSHLETFDPKPELTAHAGKTLGESPYKGVLESPYLKNVREQVANNIIDKTQARIFPTQIGFQKGGQSGIEVSDWFPNVRNCVDDLAVIRSMWTSDNNHGAQMEFLTGRHLLDGCFPTLGAWIRYGLAAQSDSVPQFVSMGYQLDSQCHGATDPDYLGPENAGIVLKVDPENPLPYAKPARPLSAVQARSRADLLGRLNRLSALDHPDDATLRARIQSYELAFKMQTAIPELLKFETETPATQKMYGLDQDVTRPFGQQLLAARRMVERGVRFVQIFHGDGAAGSWDAHSALKQNHTSLCAQVDLPTAGLIRDLKQRGLLDETIVVFATEGGGIRGGVVHGATDELGFHAVEHRHYVTDVHATILHQLGLDSHRLEIPGRKRLEMEHGHVISQILGKTGSPR